MIHDGIPQKRSRKWLTIPPGDNQRLPRVIFLPRVGEGIAPASPQIIQASEKPENTPSRMDRVDTPRASGNGCHRVQRLRERGVVGSIIGECVLIETAEWDLYGRLLHSELRFSVRVYVPGFELKARRPHSSSREWRERGPVPQERLRPWNDG